MQTCGVSGHIVTSKAWLRSRVDVDSILYCSSIQRVICVCVFAAVEMGYDRYKFIVQVVVGEQRGQGVK